MGVAISPTTVDDFGVLWWRVGDRLISGRERSEARLERIEADIAELKTEVGQLREQMTRLEVSQARAFDRMEAQFELLRGMIGRAELGG